MIFQEMSAGSINALDRSNTLVLFPIAAVEQHGPHLPTGTDTIICDAISSEVERARQQTLLRLPTQWIGASAHHLRLGATLDCPLPEYTTLLCATLRPLLENGFRRFLILNGHGGNIDPMRIALRQLQTDWPQTILSAAAYWSIAADSIADLLEGRDKAVGHACEVETSLVMHLRPELVDQEQLQPAENWKPDMIEGMFLCQDMKQRTAAGATGRPDLATVEKGQRLFDAIVRKVTDATDRLLDLPVPS